TALVNNPGAQISESGLAKIVDDFGDNEMLMKAVVDRPQLPVATVEKLIHSVSGALADSLKKKYRRAGEQKQIEQEIDKARESETLRLVRRSKSQDDIDQLITQLQGSSRLTPSLILSALCQGDFAFFETSLAKLSSIPVANARK